MNAEISNRLKANAIKALNEDMRGNSSPIKIELNVLILEAQKRSLANRMESHAV